MTRRRLVRGLLFWAAGTLFLATFAHCRTRIDAAAPPSDELGAWALAALDAARLDSPVPDAPERYDAAGPIVVTAWTAGVPVAFHRGGPSLTEAIEEASAAFLANPRLTEDEAWGERGNERFRFTVEVTTGAGPLPPQWPFLELFSLVPMRDGLHAKLGDQESILTPQEIISTGHYEGGIPTPVPELSPGVRTAPMLGRLARDLGVDRETLLADGEVQRLRMHLIAESDYPRTVEVTEDNLRQASVEGAEFLLRHQKTNGQWTYVYNGATGAPRHEAYNIPRHSGTTYFIAQVDRYHGLPAARAGAIRALRWIDRTSIRSCGEHPCVEQYGRADVGSAALTVVAAAEVLAKAPDATAQRLVEGLTGFLRSLQREDGELMHEYDVRAQEPIDVQHMYYSGEAAFALLKAHEVLGDEANLEAARRLMGHLTGAGWNFLGSRYYYGEEHWTCIAAGEARERIESPEGLDFCQRWFGFNDALQYREGQTHWEVAGSYGVGPLIMPRLTPVGSRTEAFVSTYQLVKHHGQPTDEIRALVERGLGMLLRWRWAPGPTHLLADPMGAHGGMPGSPVDLNARNDFVQHAGSAWIRWADVLRQEREAEE
ncbi:MAG: hypothetical protein AAGE52_05240 [Myxococcota bacterium]